MRLFLDANVLFTAAHNATGKAALIIELGSKGEWELFSSPFAVEEARRNLELKFPVFLERLTRFQSRIQLVEHRANDNFPDGLAQKDRPIFQAAIASRSTHLLTGDLKHFGPFMNQTDQTFGILVQTTAQFLVESRMS